MKSLLDSVDNSINADMPMLQGLTNAGPATMGIPMPLPQMDAPRAYNPLDNYSPTPNMMATLGNFDDEEDGLFPDTDPMHFDDEDIFETSPFLGIAIGKKAKARKAAKKAAKKAAQAAEIAAIGADSPWLQPNQVTPENYNPLAVAPPVQSESPLLQNVNMAQPAVNDLYQNLVNQSQNAQGFQTQLTPITQPVQPDKYKSIKYVGIGFALVLALYFIIIKAHK